jgi:hypothetical protein
MALFDSIRLIPRDSDFLSQYRLSNGDIFYDNDRKTLVVFDGITKGGIPLLRADLSNIAGGGSVSSGVIDFGSTNISANKFIGDGSELTNLPIPNNLATVDFVNEAISNVTIGPATTSTLGTVIVGTGLSITPEGVLTADGIANITSLSNLTSLSFVTGAAITSFSTDSTFINNSNSVVPTESAVKSYVDTSISNIDLDANGIVQTGSASQLAFYASNGKTVSSTGSSLVWNSLTNTLSSANLNISNNLIANALSSQSLSVSTNANILGNLTVNENAVIKGSVELNEFFNVGSGVVEFSVGADFIIDTPGFVNVKNSRITNLGNPLDPKDAVNKEYVDGAASAFSGGVVPNPINITSTQASSSTTTGALTVAGGIGVSGSIYSGGPIFVNGSAVLTSLSGGFNGGTISGTIFVNNITEAISVNSGALRVAGGVGVGRTLHVGADGFFNSIRIGNGTASAGDGFVQNIVLGGGSPLGANISGVNTLAIGFNALAQCIDGSDNIAIGSESMFNKPSGSRNIAIGSESLVQHDGFDNIAIGNNAGKDLLSGDFNVIIGGNTGTSINGLNRHILISDGGGLVRIKINNNGALSFDGVNYGETDAVLVSKGSGAPPEWSSVDAFGFDGGTVTNNTTFTSNTASTSTSTGAVVVTGGVGIGGALYIGGVVRMSNNTASTSTSTGAVVVTGGVGIGGALYIGGALNVNNSITANGIENTPIGETTRSSGAFTTLTANGVSTFTNTTASTTTANGSVVISGGLGVAGTINSNSIVAQLSTLGSVTVNGATNLQQISEVLDTKINATGTVIHDFSTAAIWYHTTPANNFTANFSNVPIVNNRVSTVALVIVQGATARIPSAVQVNGGAVAINWFNNAVPSGTANRTEIFTFNLIRVSNTWRVLGAAQSF